MGGREAPVQEDAVFHGSIVALITPFRRSTESRPGGGGPEGGVAEPAFQAFVEGPIAQGTHGLVPCGTTGESPTLSHDEHKRVIELCIEATARRIPVIAGTGSNSTSEAIALTKHAKAAGADA